MCFTDNGNDMDADILAQIFERFYTTCPGQGGPGLGLSISLNIVAGVLGGTLSASAVLGQESQLPSTCKIKLGDLHRQTAH